MLNGYIGGYRQLSLVQIRTCGLLNEHCLTHLSHVCLLRQPIWALNGVAFVFA